ncbi:Z1 domain-containing protein [Legionella longbeachae]|uniref:Z1 domain-containing protein n=1 Tax=Legionella longbeachae TaxID=450 RepID=UPI00399D1A40
MPFDPTILTESNLNRYDKQLERISNDSGYTENIQEAVVNAIDNITTGCKSFVIYGEPQSGKTEMMIALTAKLLDAENKIIIILLNDNVQLLNQNLDRFKRSGINPTPRNFDEVINQVTDIRNSEWIIFSKKNSKDLQKLLTIIGSEKNKVIIDDEADYASPNAKINKQEQTKINELVEKLISDNGIYIGVTATPARLDLNNTFRNENQKWVYFHPHKNYCGHDIFFSPLEPIGNLIKLIPDNEDSKKSLSTCLFSFLINIAYLNLRKNSNEENYCMLVHTSGKKIDHIEDQKNLEKIFNILTHQTNSKFTKYYKKIWEITNNKFNGDEELTQEIIKYIRNNIKRYQIIVINSEHDKEKVKGATRPSSLFTIAIGGNIVSRGVTFENLISMYFTRTTKHYIQQDTYIQRARMFGYRKGYLGQFELHIPEQLYKEWQKCFVYHRLSLELIRTGRGVPSWFEDKRVTSVAKSSIDKNTVLLYHGEMAFGIFKYTNEIEKIINKESHSYLEKLTKLHTIIGDASLPMCLIDFIHGTSNGHNDKIAIHNPGSVSNRRTVDPITITRTGGGMLGTGDLELNKFPHAYHHIKIFYTENGDAKLYYKYQRERIKIRRNVGNNHD